MLELLTAEEMHRADAAAIAGGVDGYTLMGAAAQAVANAVQRLFPQPCRVVVVAGCGNNGGDGAVAAQRLEQVGYRVTLVKVGAGEPSQADARRAFAEWSGDCLIFDTASGRPPTDPANARECGQEGAQEGAPECAPESQCLAAIEAADVIIDALFGAGLDRDVVEPLAGLVNTINSARGRVIAIDLPSGIDGNRFCIRGTAVRACHTVTFFRFKPAHLLYPGRACCGTLELAQIGIPEQVLDAIGACCFINDPTLWQTRLPAPAPAGHKFDRGHVMVRGGPIHQAGAARLSAQTALQCGAGLVSLATPADALASNAAQLTAVMLRSCEDSLDWRDLISDSRISTVVVGPGNGVGASTRQCVEAALVNDKACVIDADALTSCAEQPAALFESIADSESSVVLTPHAGEFLRLFPAATAASLGSRLHQARAAAAQAGAVIVLKGADTVVAAPDGRATINDNAPPWLATAGAGDVLAGVIGSLLAQGMNAFDAANAGVWCHGDAAARLGYPMTAEQLVLAVGQALGALTHLAAPQQPLGLELRHRQAESGTRSR